MRRVLSFDLDNCLFHEGYFRASHKDAMNVITSNKALLDAIMADNKKFDEIIVMIGSARQSAYKDRLNSNVNGTEQGFTAIRTVSDYLFARLETFLLADVYGNIADGTAYNNAIDSLYVGKHPDWIVDETKITILYAQMQKIATRYPHDEIMFDFFDDRGRGSYTPVDILELLEDYFRRYRSMIPSNVTLRLHHYEGGELSSYTPIQGCGSLNAAYRKTIKDMTRIAQSTTFLTAEKVFLSGSVFEVTLAQLGLDSALKKNNQHGLYDCVNSCLKPLFVFFQPKTREELLPDKEAHLKIR